MIFQNGKMCATIMTYGQNQMKMVSVSLTEFYASWLKPNEGKMGVRHRRQ